MMDDLETRLEAAEKELKLQITGTKDCVKELVKVTRERDELRTGWGKRIEDLTDQRNEYSKKAYELQLSLATAERERDEAQKLMRSANREACKAMDTADEHKRLLKLNKTLNERQKDALTARAEAAERQIEFHKLNDEVSEVNLDEATTLLSNMAGALEGLGKRVVIYNTAHYMDVEIKAAQAQLAAYNEWKGRG